MSWSISQLPAFVKTLPDSDQLDYAVNHLKWMEEHCTGDDGQRHLRRFAVETLNRFGQPGCTLYNDEKVLYVILLMGRLSRSLGMKGVLEQVYERGQFHNVAEFYVQWAKVYAEEKDRNRFDEIHELAIKANAQPSSRIDEAFRAMAYENFEAEEFEPTVNLFAKKQQGKLDLHKLGSTEQSRVVISTQPPVSSKSVLHTPAPSISSTHAPSESVKEVSSKTAVASVKANGLLVIDEELSPEERAATLIGYPYPPEPATSSEHKLSVISEEKTGYYNEDVPMETSYSQSHNENEVDEQMGSSNGVTPAIIAAKNVPMIEVVPPPIPHRTSLSTRKPLSSMPIPPPPTPPRKTNEAIAMSSPIELGGTSFTEKFYTKAMQEFSNTLPVHPPRAAPFENDTTVLNETEDLPVVAASTARAAVPTFDIYRESESFVAKRENEANVAEMCKEEMGSKQMASQFEVYNDENEGPRKDGIDESQLKSAIETKGAGDAIPPTQSSQVMEIKNERDAPLGGGDLFKKPELIPSHPRKSVGFDTSTTSMFARTHLQQRHSIFDMKQGADNRSVDFRSATEFPDGADEETVAGLFKNKKSGPVTSTPANPLAPCIQDPIGGGYMLDSATATNAADVMLPVSGSQAPKTSQSAFERRFGLASESAKVHPPATTFSNIAQKAGKLTPIIERSLKEMQLNDNEDDADEPTGHGLKTAIESEVNPWDHKLQETIMINRRLAPTYLHDFSERIRRFVAGVSVVLGGERFELEAVIGEGGFAKVFKSLSEDGKTYAIKYEVPACRWEVYMCEALRLRLPCYILPAVMTIRDAYVYANASAIVYQYHPNGNLLDMVNGISKEHKTCSGLLVVYLAWQMARILQAVHGAKLIHGDIKPDNFMVVARLNENSSLNEIMQEDYFILKLIDWGRGIDMAALGDRTFKGRAGTETFDCVEMTDGRPWTYQTDFFGFVSTIHVLIFGNYMSVRKNERAGRFEMTSILKRRWQQRDLLQDIFDMCLNIPDCDSQPKWSIIVEGLAQNIRYTISGDKMQWKSAAREFNAAIRR